MATTWNIEPMKVARSKYGAAPLRNENFIEEASQAFSKYDPLMRDGTNMNELEIYDDGNSSLVTGLAVADASGSAGTTVRIWEIHEGTICEANLVNESSATAVTQTSIGVRYGVKEHASGQWIVDLSDTSASTVRVQVTGLAGMAEFGDTNPRVEFFWLDSFTES